jgi:hypothetical protein
MTAMFLQSITNRNLIQKEIKKRLNSGNACYRSVQNLFSFCLLSKNIIIRACRTIILPVVLYGCKTFSLTLREEHRLRVSENRVLRSIFGSKRDEVTGGWRKLHNEALHNLCPTPSIIRTIKSRRMRWAGHRARTKERINAFRTMVGKPEGKRALGRPRRRRVENVKMDLKEIGWEGMDWIDLAQDRDQWRALVNTVMNLRVLKKGSAP